MRAIWGLILGLMLIAPASAQEVTRDLVRSVLEESDCQRVLPGHEDVEGDATTEGTRTRTSQRGRSVFSGAGFGRGISMILLWSFLTVVVVVLVATLIRSRRSTAPRHVAQGPRAVPIPAEPAPPPLPEHERLAAAGDFAAAVHAALLHAFASCAKCMGTLPPHATGRQVLRLARLHPLPTADLGQLVTAVERVHFGGQVADRDLYEASQRHLQHWEAACQTEAGASQP